MKNNLTKKVLIIILTFLLLVACIPNSVKAITVDLDVDTDFFRDMFINYYMESLGVAQNVAATSTDALFNQYDNADERLVNEYNSAYQSSTATDELQKRRDALSQAISTVFEGTNLAQNADTIVSYADVGEINVENVRDDIIAYMENTYNISDTQQATQIAESVIARYNELVGDNEDSLSYQEKLDLLQQAIDEIVEEQGLGGVDSDEVIGSSDQDTSTDQGPTVGNLIDGLAGIVFWVLKLIPMLAGWLLLRIIGLAIDGVDGLVHGLPLDRILFNEIPLLSVNFFQDVDSSVSNALVINSIRDQVSVWYVAIRNLSAAILAVMVLYVGIRMAISSVAEEKARYKRMLVDWVVSLVLLFVLHYIMILIININDGIVAILAGANPGSTGDALTIMDDLWVKAMASVFSFTEQVGYMALYFMLAIMCFVFFATYVKRMITIAFLIMIAPIITITYSLDRMGDGKSQALNTWFKNFVYNILLQPFQCIIYLALVKTAIDSISANNLSSVVIAIIMVFFMYEAEDIIKEIFHFEGKSVANTIAQAALVSSAIGLVSKAAVTKAAVKGYAGNTPSQNNNQGGQPQQPQQPQQPPATSDNPWEDYANDSDNYMDNSANNRQQENQRQNNTPEPSNRQNQPNQPNQQTGNKKGTIGGVVGNIAKKAGVAALKGAAKLPLAIALGAASLGTGNLSNAITGAQTGWGISGNILSNESEKGHIHNFAKIYNDLVGANGQNIYAGHDNNWIREHTKDLLNGDVQAKDYEKEYYDAILKEMDRYIDQGLSADDAVTQVEQNVAGIQGGYLGEATLRQRFTGRINQVINRRRNNHNYNSPDGDVNNNNEPEDDENI